MNAQNKSSPPTTPSTSPVIERIYFARTAVNPESSAHNVIEIVQRVVHAPLPAGYTEIDDVIRESESNSQRAAALARARQRLATQLDVSPSRPTVAYLRLKAGLSQAKVAERLGNSQSSYSLIESGSRVDIHFSTFEKLVEIFNVSRDELAEALKNTRARTS